MARLYLALQITIPICTRLSLYSVVPLRHQRRGYHQYEYTHDMVLFLVTYRAPCTSHESYRLPSLMHAQGSLARLCKLPASLVCKQRHQLL